MYKKLYLFDFLFSLSELKILIVVKRFSLFAALLFITNIYSQNCVQGTMDLSVQFGVNPNDISISVVNQTGQKIITYNQFQNIPAYGSFTATLPTIPSGNYNLLVIDWSGSGLLNGTYSLTDGNNVIVSKQQFTYSEASTFCFGNTTLNTSIDTSPPGQTSNVQMVSHNGNNANLNWVRGIDNIFITKSQVILNGSVFYPEVWSQLQTLSNIPVAQPQEVKVHTLDFMGNVGAPDDYAFMLPEGNCAQSNLTLDLTFPPGGINVEFSIFNSSYQVVWSNSYGNNYSGSSITENMPTLPSGDYLLSGISPTGGIGAAYDLKSGGQTILSGPNLVPLSHVRPFCVSNSNYFVWDLEKPTAPVLNVGSVIPGSIDLNWSSGTDNRGVTEYYIYYPSGQLLGTTSQTSFTVNHNGVPFQTHYFVVRARDQVGNFSPVSNTVSVFLPAPVSWRDYNYGYYENGWDGWSSSGNASKRVNKSHHSYEQDWSIKMHAHQGGSPIYSPIEDLTYYDGVYLTFYVKTKGMNLGEGFKIQFFNGTVWVDVGQAIRGVDFQNGSFNVVQIWLSGLDYNMSSLSQFRIINTGNQKNDRFWIDQTKLTKRVGPLSTAFNISQVATPRLANAENVVVNNKQDLEIELKIYPNPSDGIVELSVSEIGDYQVQIHDIRGVKMLELKIIGEECEFDMSKWDSGIYVLTLSNGSVQKQTRIIKK